MKKRNKFYSLLRKPITKLLTVWATLKNRNSFIRFNIDITFIKYFSVCIPLTLDSELKENSTSKLHLWVFDNKIGFNIVVPQFLFFNQNHSVSYKYIHFALFIKVIAFWIYLNPGNSFDNNNLKNLCNKISNFTLFENWYIKLFKKC